MRLRNGKFIRWNNDGYCYIGDSNSNLAKFANYTDITNLQNQIAGLSFGGQLLMWNVTTKRDTLTNLIDYEPQAILFIPAFAAFGDTIGVFISFMSHTNQWFINVNNTSGARRESGVASIRTSRFDDICQVDTNPTYPILMACIIWK